MNVPPKRPLLRLRRLAIGALRVGVIAAALLFLARGWRGTWADVAKILQSAELGPLVGVVALNAAMMALKAFRLRLLLGGRASFRACFLAKLTASAINNMAPLRGGDVARVWMLERHAGITKSAAAMVAVVETLFELGALALLAFVVMAAGGGVPEQHWAVALAPVLAIVAFAGIFLVRRAGGVGEGAPVPALRPGPLGRVRALVRRVAPGARELRRPGTMEVSLGLSLAAWVVEAAMVILCARAIHLSVGPTLSILVLLGINVALAVPSLPAGAGAFEAAVTLVLVLSGTARGPAVAFAVLYHLVQVVPVTVAGVLVVLRAGVTLGGLPARRWDQVH